VEHEIKILKHKEHEHHHDHCIAIVKGLEKIRNKILNKVDKCVSNHIDEGINVEGKIARATERFLTKTENLAKQAAQCVASNVIHSDAIACLNNVST
jgi:hypothetical protein